MIILSCPECHVQYKLDPAELGAKGREVRCTNCRFIWFQAPYSPFPPAPVEEAAPEPQPGTFIPLPDDVAEATEAPTEFSAALAEHIEERLGGRQQQEQTLPIVTHNPLGVSADVFGALSFCLCLFLTLTILFVAQKPIVGHWPQMVVLYKMMGFSPRAPGEGLRMSELVAEQRIEKQNKILAVEGKITNMTEHDIAYPPLHVTIKNEQDMVMKEWDLKPSSSKIASGVTIPLMLQLADAPDDSAVVELRVKSE